MLRLISFLITLPLTLLVVDFAVSNRSPAQFSLFPLTETFEMPLFLPVMLALLLGLGFGSLIVWAGGHRTRARARREARRANQLAAELAEVQVGNGLQPGPVLLGEKRRTTEAPSTTLLS